ncbi:hypothetical protein [uncultured Gimesia sp.]|uniref:hypothetical protein n=1 Tax=uncultured Gimesia sp. TaxID=1678688 RepID=UPI00261016E4|nr:hypothetical protein [uncultured Gimesia sp.]
MKYLIAAVIAGILILGMFIYIWSVESEILKIAGVEDMESLEDLGMELTGGQLLRFSIADLLKFYRLPLSILILCTSFGIAYLCGSTKKSSENEIRSMDQNQK